MSRTDPPPVFNFDNDCSLLPSDPDYLPWNDCYLDLLKYYGHNFTRGWAWEQAKWHPCESDDWYFDPLPYKRTGPGNALDGKPKFDLTKFDATYFDRLRQRAIAAGNRGYYISIMLFEGWGIDDKQCGKDNAWEGHPMNAANNINGINGDCNGDGQGSELHTLPSDTYYNPPVSQEIIDIEEAYVAHCIDELNDLDNIFWEISNESYPNSTNWQYHMIDFIHSYEASKASPDDNYKQHLVWMNAYDANNSVLFDSNCHAEVVSPHAHGSVDYRTPPAWSENKNKIVILDTDHLWGWGGDRDFVWKAFTRGYHPIYMDPLQQPWRWPPEDPRSIRVRWALGYTLCYAKRMNLRDVTPQNALSSTSYCLADPGMEYLVLQLSSGVSFTVNLLAGSYDYEWFNTTTGTVVQTGNFTWAGGNKSFTPPFGGAYAVLYLVEIAGPVALINANPSIGPSPLTVNFNGSASYDKSGGNIISYEW
ncbi:MAG: DUF6298 domain-containing protein, partial [Planctomycetota bacterium]